MNTWDIFGEGNDKLTPQEKFKRSVKRAGYDMDAGADRLEKLLAKQKAERDAREKHEHEHEQNEEFTGYWKGTDKAPPGRKMVGADESVNRQEVDYDDDYQDMVRRVGAKAKAADALKAQNKEPQTKFNSKTGKYYVDFGATDKTANENTVTKKWKAVYQSHNGRSNFITVEAPSREQAIDIARTNINAFSHRGKENTLTDIKEIPFPPAQIDQFESAAEGYANYDDEYNDQDDQSQELYSGCYVRDEQDPSGEIFQMRGDPSERRVQITDRNGSGWNISPERLVLVGEGDPDIARYFGGKDIDEAGYGRNRGYSHGFASPHAPSLGVGGRREREDDEGYEQERREQNQNWYIRINGKLLKDKKQQPYTFQGKEAARKAALTMMAKPFNAGKKFTLTTSWMDAPVAESVSDVKKKISKYEELALAAPRAGDDAKCKQYQQKVQALKQKMSQGVAEARDGDTNFGSTVTRGSWVVYDGSKVKRFKSRDGAKAYADKNGGKVASSEFYADKIQKQGVAEAEMPDLSPEMQQAKQQQQIMISDTPPQDDNLNMLKAWAEYSPHRRIDYYVIAKFGNKGPNRNIFSNSVQKTLSAISNFPDMSGQELYNQFDLDQRDADRLYAAYENVADEFDQLSEQGVAEAGPFSYGARKPRKGSVAANAEQKRKEQDKGKQPVEPRDQRVGTAQVTKGVAEGAVKTLSMDLKSMPEKEFVAKYNKTKAEARAAMKNLDEDQQLEEAVERAILSMTEDGYEFAVEGIKQRLDPKCWKGKHKEGTKIKGGIRVNNCVPNK